MKRNRIECGRAWAAFFIGLFGVASPAVGWDAVLPRSTTRPTSGLTVKVAVSDVASSGYGVVDVFVGPLGGRVKTERTVTITLTSFGGYPLRLRPSATTTITLPAGSTGVTKSVAVPYARFWGAYSLRTEESGRDLRDLTAEVISAPGRYRSFGLEVCNILVIDRAAPTRAEQASPRALNSLFGIAGSAAAKKSRKLPDIRYLVAPVAPRNTANYGFYAAQLSSRSAPEPTVAPAADREILNSFSNMDCLELCPPAELPDQWLQLSPFDLIVISYRDLKTLHATRHQQWRAIRDWTAAGGNLIIYGAGIEERDLKAIDRVVECPGDTDYFRYGPVWTRPNKTTRRTALQGRDLLDGAGFYGNMSGNTVVTTPSAANKPSPSKAADRFDFRLRELGFGTIVALAPRDPFPGRTRDWVWMFNTLGWNRWLWEGRHGNSPAAGNTGTWKLLVPGVGMPPVGVFIVLISVFVIVVGPVNYLLLRRAGRLYLLLITVPVAAAILVVGTFAYAVLADGLDVKLRVHSLTLLDQRAKQQVSWSWQTYYASLLPSGGLVFPADAAVYPLTSEVDSDSNSGRIYHTVWEDGQQRLAAGYLQPRIQGFFSVTQPGTSTLGLEVTGGARQDDPIHVVNRLETDIHQGLLIGANGQPYWIENLPGGAEADIRVDSTGAAAGRLRDVFQTHHLRVPEGITPGQMNSGRRRWYYYASNRDWTISMSLVARRLARLEQLLDKLPPRHYVAIVENPRSVPVGVKDAVRTGGFHVIAGRW